MKATIHAVNQKGSDLKLSLDGSWTVRNSDGSKTIEGVLEVSADDLQFMGVIDLGSPTMSRDIEYRHQEVFVELNGWQIKYVGPVSRVVGGPKEVVVNEKRPRFSYRRRKKTGPWEGIIGGRLSNVGEWQQAINSLNEAKVKT